MQETDMHTHMHTHTNAYTRTHMHACRHEPIMKALLLFPQLRHVHRMQLQSISFDWRIEK